MPLSSSLPTDPKPTHPEALTREALTFLRGEGVDGLTDNALTSSTVDVVARDPASLAKSLQKFCAQTDAKLVGAAPERRAWTFTLARQANGALEFVRFRDLSGAAADSLSLPETFSRLNDFSHGVKQILKPTGLFVVFLGADGSGKSTVIAQVERSLAPAFSSVERYHLRPHFGQDRSGSPVVTDPHAEAPRSLPMSVAKLGLWGTDYLHGYLSTIRRQLARGALVIFDRYYPDLLVDAKRYRYGGPQVLAQAVGWFIPKPELVVLLDAPAEVLQSRKQEVTFEETARQRQAYLDLVTALPNGHVVDAAQPLNGVVAAVNTVILDYLAERTATRLGRTMS